MPASDHLDKVGIIGATIAALCCLGLPAILSVLTAIGLGFIVNDAVLAPLLIVSLALIVWALVRGFRRHGNATALVIGSAASLILVMATLIWPLRSRASPTSCCYTGVTFDADSGNVAFRSVLYAVLSPHGGY